MSHENNSSKFVDGRQTMNRTKDKSAKKYTFETISTTQQLVIIDL